MCSFFLYEWKLYVNILNFPLIKFVTSFKCQCCLFANILSLMSEKIAHLFNNFLIILLKK